MLLEAAMVSIITQAPQQTPTITLKGLALLTLPIRAIHQTQRESTKVARTNKESVQESIPKGKKAIHLLSMITPSQAEGIMRKPTETCIQVLIM